MRKQPLVTFRTMNGYTVWFAPPAPESADSESRKIQRRFVVRDPSGQEHDCVVVIPPSLQEQIRLQTGQDLPSADGFWDTVCRLALQRQVMRVGAIPAERLYVRELSPREWGTVLRLARPDPPRRRRLR
jgi:hypothetical protein